MQEKIIFRSMDHSDTIAKYIHNKIEKLNKFFKREPLPIQLDIVVEGHRHKNFFNLECKINSIHHHIFLKKGGNDLYAMIDDIVCAITKNIIRQKEKMEYNQHHPLVHIV